jgi:hypothetical protein
MSRLYCTAKQLEVKEKRQRRRQRGGEERNWFLLKREGSEYANAAMNKIVATSTLYGSS